eukprot:RCo033600
MAEFCSFWKVDNIAVRWGHSAVLYEGRMFVFAGVDGPEFSTEVLLFELDPPSTFAKGPVMPTNQRKPPTARALHTTVLLGAKAVLYGGWSPAKGTALGDLHMWDCEARTWSGAVEAIGPAPLPRWGHSAVLYGQRMVVYGGQSDG